MSTALKIPAYDIRNAVTKNRLVGMWRIMHGFRLTYLAAVLCLAVSALAKSATYLFLRNFIDNILGKEDMVHLLPWVALGFVGFAAVEGSFAFFSGRLSARTSEGITLRLRNFIYDHIQRLPFSYFSRTTTGELIQRSTSDIDAVRRFFADQAIGVGRIFLLFTINFTLIMMINVQLALVSIIAIPFILGTSIFFFRKVSKAYEKYQEQEAVLSTTLQENLTGVRVVKAFARQEYERNKFDKDNWEKFLRGRRLLLIHSAFWPSSDIISGIQMIIGFLVGALMTMNGTITVGSYLAYAGLIIWIIWPMRNLGRLIVQASSGLVSFNRVIEIVKENEEALDEGDYLPIGDVKGHLQFIDVSFAYEDDDQTVLEGINFEVLPGQVVALIGSTGSGKTTLVNLIPRFYDYTGGSLLLDGVELTRYPPSYIRTQIGIVEQEPFLFSRTIRDNISYGVGRDIAQEEIEAAASAAAIHDVISTFPEGYDTIVGEKGVTLSGGQKQRVTIARTLLKSPRILILDNSTSSVDTQTEAEIREALDHLMKDRTTFIIAHRIQSVMNADLILVLEQGKIVQRGTHEELILQEGVYKQIYDIQTRIETELQKEITSVQELASASLD